MSDAFNKKTVLQFVDDGLFPGGVHLFDSIDSTNDWSLGELRQGRALPFVCMADHQSKGRGRRGRRWLSPPAANIYLSLAWHFQLSADRLGVLSLAQGVAVIRALKTIGINNAWLKWPNDVLIEDEKIAGVLIETSGIRANSCNAVIGIGLNCRMPENVVAESEMHWTDVARSIEGVPDRNALAATVISETINMCRQYQQKGAAIISEFGHELAVLQGRDVEVHLDDGSHLTATVLGINAAGELRVLVKGRERVFNSADVSLKKPVDQGEAGELC